MRSYEIRGRTVPFPHDAYDIQVTYMEKVLEALDEGKHALLESPTGTGKTLCLLSAALAWRKDEMEKRGVSKTWISSKTGQRNSKNMKMPLNDKEPEGNPPRPFPPIIYASRTHSQLSQVMRELKKTNHELNATVLGSRAKHCAHPKVRTLPNTLAGLTCRSLTSKGRCEWNSKVTELKMDTAKMEKLSKAVLDIEDLHKLAEPSGPCPFYLTREMAPNADIVFVPYNYLVDGRQRRRLPVEFIDAVVIFDEAHNVEQSCCDAASFELTAGTFQAALNELDKAVKCIQGRHGIPPEKQPNLPPTLKSWDKLQTHCLNLQNGLDKIHEHMTTNLPPEKGKTLPGAHIFDFFKIGGISGMNHSACVNGLSDAAAILADPAFEELRGQNTTGTACYTIADAVELAFFAMGAPSPKEPAYHLSYRVHMHMEKRRNGAFVPSIAFWCFSPAIAMREFASQGVRSIILTSGTLSPLYAMATEFKLAFPVRLESQHIVKPSQVHLSVVPVGPAGHTLDSSYQYRNNKEFQDDMGSSIVHVARMVPDGLICFFPSYAFMQMCLEHWKLPRPGRTSVMEAVRQYKHVIFEPQDAALFPMTISKYKAKLDDKSRNGSIFFCVCRGKVSEGLDFANKECRGVVICGIPFANPYDPKVSAKMEVLDREPRGGLKGREWFTQAALRAVNQAMGRVIRHKDDYGSILLFDRRFSQTNNKNLLSKWLRGMLITQPNFGKVAGALTKFFSSKRTQTDIKPDPCLTWGHQEVKTEQKPFISGGLSFPRIKTESIKQEENMEPTSKKRRLVVPAANESHSHSELTSFVKVEEPYIKVEQNQTAEPMGLLALMGQEPASCRVKVESSLQTETAGPSVRRKINWGRQGLRGWLSQGPKDEPQDTCTGPMSDMNPMERETTLQSEVIDCVQPSHQNIRVKREPNVSTGSHRTTGHSVRENDSKDLLVRLRRQLDSAAVIEIVKVLKKYKQHEIDQSEFVDILIPILNKPDTKLLLLEFVPFITKNKDDFMKKLKEIGVGN